MLNEVGTPAHGVIPTTPGQGRAKGETQEKRDNQPILFKTEKSKKKQENQDDPAQESQRPGSDITAPISKPQSLEQVSEVVRQLVTETGIKMADLLENLAESPPMAA